MSQFLEKTALIVAVCTSAHSPVLAVQDRTQQQIPTGTVTGVVTDASTGSPLSGAQVSIPPDMGAVTDSEGRYLILNVPSGTVQLNAALIGYRRQSTEVVIPANGTAVADIVLEQSAISLEDIVVPVDPGFSWPWSTFFVLLGTFLGMELWPLRLRRRGRTASPRRASIAGALVGTATGTAMAMVVNRPWEFVETFQDFVFLFFDLAYFVPVAFGLMVAYGSRMSGYIGIIGAAIIGNLIATVALMIVNGALYDALELSYFADWRTWRNTADEGFSLGLAVALRCRLRRPWGARPASRSSEVAAA